MNNWFDEMELDEQKHDELEYERAMSFHDGYNKAIDDVFKGLLENTNPTEKYIDSVIIVRLLKHLKGENI